MSVRVLIVDDEALARQRVRRLLQNEADVEVVGEAESGHITQKLFNKNIHLQGFKLRW